MRNILFVFSLIFFSAAITQFADDEEDEFEYKVFSDSSRTFAFPKSIDELQPYFQQSNFFVLLYFTSA